MLLSTALLPLGPYRYKSHNSRHDPKFSKLNCLLTGLVAYHSHHHNSGHYKGHILTKLLQTA